MAVEMCAQMDEQICPRCKTSKQRNPSMRMLVNECGHPLCENCVDTLFFKGSGQCLKCKIELRKNNFRLQLFDDPYVEKDITIRKKLSKIYNKLEEDFSSLRDYNDYLEEFETLVFNLVNDIDVETTKLKIEQYKKENKDSIVKNRGKMSREEQLLRDLLDEERQATEERLQQIATEEQEAVQRRSQKKEALITGLMNSTRPLDEIITSYTSEATQVPKPAAPKHTATKQFSTGIRFGQCETFIPIPTRKKNAFSHVDYTQEILGPEVPPVDALINNNFVRHIKTPFDYARVAGFSAANTCSAILKQAYNCLHI